MRRALFKFKQCADAADALGVVLKQHFVFLDGAIVLQKCTLEEIEAVEE